MLLPVLIIFLRTTSVVDGAASIHQSLGHIKGVANSNSPEKIAALISGLENLPTIKNEKTTCASQKVETRLMEFKDSLEQDCGTLTHFDNQGSATKTSLKRMEVESHIAQCQNETLERHYNNFIARLVPLNCNMQDLSNLVNVELKDMTWYQVATTLIRYIDEHMSRNARNVPDNYDGLASFSSQSLLPLFKRRARGKE